MFVSHFRLPVWCPLTSFSYTRGWSLNEVRTFWFLLPSFLRCQWRQQYYILQRQSLLGELRKKERRCLFFLNSLRASLGLTVLHRQIWNYFSGAGSREWHLTEIPHFYSGSWATLRLPAWGSIILPLACSFWVLEVVVVLVELDKVLEAGAGHTWSFHTSIGIFRTSGGDRPCSVMGIFANIPARELFLCRSLMCVHLVYFIFSWGIIGPLITE